MGIKKQKQENDIDDFTPNPKYGIDFENNYVMRFFDC